MFISIYIPNNLLNRGHNRLRASDTMRKVTKTITERVVNPTIVIIGFYVGANEVNATIIAHPFIIQTCVHHPKREINRSISNMRRFDKVQVTICLRKPEPPAKQLYIKRSPIGSKSSSKVPVSIFSN